jgi:hypothetical protein
MEVLWQLCVSKIGCRWPLIVHCGVEDRNKNILDLMQFSLEEG